MGVIAEYPSRLRTGPADEPGSLSQWALIRRRFGRHRWGGGPRTVEGSLAFLATGVAIMTLFPAVPFWVGVASVVVACGAEALPGPFNDNVRVPLVAAFVILALERLV